MVVVPPPAGRVGLCLVSTAPGAAATNPQSSVPQEHGLSKCAELRCEPLGWELGDWGLQIVAQAPL